MNPIPGVTGSETILARGQAGTPVVVLEWMVISGAPHATAQMLARTRASAAVAIAQLISLVPGAPEQTRLAKQVIPFLNTPGTIAQGVAPLRGPDGKISLASITAGLSGHAGGVNALMIDGSVKFVCDSLALNLRRDMQLGAYGENWEANPGIAGPFGDSGAILASFFSYGDLAGMTSTLIPTHSVAETLRSILSRAEAARLIGDRTAERDALQTYMDSLAGV